ncbi:MAG: hypothetical protein HY089_00795, partial [Ignavibacteriales bacterium]|nr:hypothetical protein [Ignavibacteriales bacterium]
MKRFFWLIFIALNIASAQDSVDVVFRYTPPTAQSSVWLPGEFNGWNPPTQWPMTPIGNNTFTRKVRLRVGGQPGGGVAGAYQYKFYYSGVTDWPNDPLNPRFNSSDNNNSILYITSPTIYHFIPNQRVDGGLVRTSNPTISAYLFPKVSS